MPPPPKRNAEEAFAQPILHEEGPNLEDDLFVLPDLDDGLDCSNIDNPLFHAVKSRPLAGRSAPSADGMVFPPEKNVDHDGSMIEVLSLQSRRAL